MNGFRHISTRLSVWILGGTAIALLGLGYYQQRLNGRIVLEQVGGRAAAVTSSITEELQGVLRAVETSVQLTSARLEAHPAPPAEIEEMLTEMIRTNGRIYGSTASFEPNATAPMGLTRYAPYLFRQGEKLEHADLATPKYAYWDQDWYRIPLAQNKPIWTEPYFDDGGGNVHMVTYSVPFTQSTAKSAAPSGIITADISLGWLQGVAESNRPGKNGFVIIFSGTGRLIIDPEVKDVLKESLTTLAEKTHRPELLTVQSEVAAGRAGSVGYSSANGRSRVHLDYRPVKVGGWGVIVGYDEAEFLAPVRRATLIAVGSSLGALLMIGLVIAVVSHRITQPLTQLTATAGSIARGDMDIPIAAARTQDEIGQLTEAFRHMRDDLRQHMSDLAAATTAKQKLESELAIAQQIQRTMLPAPQHQQPGPHALNISARIVPAKTVGGDLYVYFSPTPDRLCFAIGDVSDKGVPAALFMARTITLIKTIGRDVAAPDEILRRVNAELYPDNDECMFVTLFCGMIDLATGQLTVACAGHEPPLILSATGGCRLWEIPTGPALGLSPEVTLPVSRATLAPDETLLLYTDGVTDALDPDGKMFTQERLIATVNALGPQPPHLTDFLLHTVVTFAADAPQADDITLFALQRS